MQRSRKQLTENIYSFFLQSAGVRAVKILVLVAAFVLFMPKCRNKTFLLVYNAILLHL